MWSNAFSIQVHPTSPYKRITLIKSIDTSDSTASVKLKKFMHIQSVNGLLLDGLSTDIASETIRHIEQGPVFLMVRPASKDRSKLTSPATPLTDTPLSTPGRTYPVYFAGSSRECSTKVYEVMMVPKEDNSHSFYCEISDSDFEETSTIDSGVISSKSSELGSLGSLSSIDSTNSLVISVEKPILMTTMPGQQRPSTLASFGRQSTSSNTPCPTATTPSSDPPSLVITTAESSTLGQQRPRTLASFGRQSTSSNRPYPLSISHKMLVSGSHVSVRSIDSTSSHRSVTDEDRKSSVEKPSLLTTKCVNDDWNPLPSFTHTPESLNNCGKFVLQNINFRQLQEENITLCPLQEQLYLKPNTICVYSIDLEELTLSPHTSFTRLYEFLCFFHLRHNPKGMQVILVGAYDSSTEYGSTLDDAGLDWFCSRIPELLQDKHINELLFEDRTKSRIHLIPFDLANPKKGTASLQDVIKECIKKYHLRVEATTDDNQKMPQSLKQWPLFLGKVMELSSSQPLISKEDLKRLASSVLWNDGGQLFDQCLECLYQSSLLQTNGEYSTPKCMSCDCVFIITLVLTHRSRCRQWSLDKSRPHCEGDSTTW